MNTTHLLQQVLHSIIGRTIIPNLAKEIGSGVSPKPWNSREIEYD